MYPSRLIRGTCPQNSRAKLPPHLTVRGTRVDWPSGSPGSSRSGATRVRRKPEELSPSHPPGELPPEREPSARKSELMYEALPDQLRSLLLLGHRPERFAFAAPDRKAGSSDEAPQARAPGLRERSLGGAHFAPLEVHAIEEQRSQAEARHCREARTLCRSAFHRDTLESNRVRQCQGDSQSPASR